MDGMKINKLHFLAQNNAFTFQLAQTISSQLNEYNYGLLPNALNNGNDLKLFVSADNQQQVQIRMQKCKAITLGGYVIQFDEDVAFKNKDLHTSLPGLSLPLRELIEKTSEYFVVLITNPYERVPSGEADPEEMPPRLPYSLASYSLQLMPASEISKNALGNFQLPLAKLKIEERKAWLDDEYIPPCSCISSHYELLEVHAAIEKFFSKMELYALQILQKIFRKKQDNEMAVIVQKLCEYIILFTSSKISELKLVNLYQPPVYLINTICSFARLLKNTLDFYIGSGKEGLINYFTEWCNINQSELEGAITSLANHQYDHLDIHASLIKAHDFTKTTAQLFSTLAQLEYIGKRKDAGIFIKEQIVVSEAETKPKQRRSFLAD
jgi:hypothetical protein